MVNNMRVELFRKYNSEGFDNICVARALNRFGIRIELAIQYLISNLSKMLDYEFNEDAKVILISRTADFYACCTKDFKKIKIIE